MGRGYHFYHSDNVFSKEITDWQAEALRLIHTPDTKGELINHKNNKRVHLLYLTNRCTFYFF